jgi:quinol monooxygenase YgiN
LTRITFFRLVTLSAVCLVGAMARSADTRTGAKILTFIEVRGDAVDRARNILERYEETLRRDGHALRVETLEEIARPERFVILESATRADELTGPEASARETLASLNDFLTAPPDRRANRDFTDVPAESAPASSTNVASPPRSSSELYAIAHLDIGPPDQARGVEALRRFVDAARRSPGNLRFEAWQQSNRPNHFNLIASWTSRSKLDAFTVGTAAREYRASVAPLIGSPYDQRLYRIVGSK